LRGLYGGHGAEEQREECYEQSSHEISPSLLRVGA
jgi:hypothetical protein